MVISENELEVNKKTLEIKFLIISSEDQAESILKACY